MYCKEKVVNCFDVGFGFCGENHERNIDDIAGVSHILVKNMSDSLFVDFNVYVDALKKARYNTFKIKLKNELSKTKSFNSLIAKTKRFSLSSERELYNSGGYYGYMVYMPNSDYIKADIKSLGFHVHKAGDVQVVCIDMDSGDTLYSQKHTLKEGKQVLKINESFVSDFEMNIFVGIEILTATLFNVRCGAKMEKCCPCLCEVEEVFGLLEKCGAYTTKNIKWIAQRLFCLDAQVGCDLDALICKNTDILIDSFNILVGIGILEDKLNGCGGSFYENANKELIKDTTLPKLVIDFEETLTSSTKDLYERTQDTFCYICDPIAGKTVYKSSYV